MCGRFSVGLSATTLANHFNVQESVAWRERYNLTSSQEVLTVVQPAAGAREIRRMRWGLIPAWAKDPSIGNQLPREGRSSHAPSSPRRPTRSSGDFITGWR